MTKRTLLPGPLVGKRYGVAASHRLTIESKPGRAPAPVVSRWFCSCGARGDWISERGHATATNATADAHLAEVSS